MARTRDCGAKRVQVRWRNGWNHRNKRDTDVWGPWTGQRLIILLPTEILTILGQVGPQSRRLRGVSVLSPGSADFSGGMYSIWAGTCLRSIVSMREACPASVHFPIRWYVPLFLLVLIPLLMDADTLLARVPTTEQVAVCTRWRDLQGRIISEARMAPEDREGQYKEKEAWLGRWCALWVHFLLVWRGAELTVAALRQVELSALCVAGEDVGRPISPFKDFDCD